MYELTMILSGIWFQLRQIAPYWVAGLVVGSLVSVYLSEKIAAKMTGISSGRFRLLPVCAASFLGIASPLCMYGTVPVIAALGKKDVPQHLLATFMVSSVLMNPNLFLMSFALGAKLALARLILSFIGSVLAGVIVLALFKNRALFSFEKFTQLKSKAKKKLLPDLLKALRITAPYLIFGVTLTALCDRYIPSEWIARVFGARRGLGVLFATTLSIPLYACGGGTIPLIRMWMHAGMGAGDALAFMLAGPSTKINNLSAVKMILGAKHFLYYIAYCLLFAVLAGLAAEWAF